MNSRYSWLGFAGIPKALDELKAEALKEISCGAIAGSGEILIDDDENSVEDFGEEKLSQTSNASSTSVSLKNKSALDNRKEKSLALLTQNFVKLFLTTKADTISLDESAKLLLGDVHDSTIMRTKVGRLYDIANVLSSLNLIEKNGRSSNVKMVSVNGLKSSFPSLRSSRLHICCAAKLETVSKVCKIVKKQLALSDDITLTPESKFFALGADSRHGGDCDGPRGV